MKFQAVLITAVLFASSNVHAAGSNDCMIETHMAGHALSMIKGGATLKQTIQVLADTEPKKEIIERIFQSKDVLEDQIAASELGGRLCREMTASL